MLGCKVIVLSWCEQMKILPIVSKLLVEVLFTGMTVVLKSADTGTLLDTPEGTTSLLRQVVINEILVKTGVELKKLDARAVKFDAFWVRKLLGVNVTETTVTVVRACETDVGCDVALFGVTVTKADDTAAVVCVSVTDVALTAALLLIPKLELRRNEVLPLKLEETTLLVG